MSEEDTYAGFDCLDFANVAPEKKEGHESAPVSGHGGSDLGVRHSSSPVYGGHSHGHGVCLDQQFFLEEALGAYHDVAQANIDEFTTNADLFEVFDHAILECGSQVPSTNPLLQPSSSSPAVADEESFGSNQSPTKCESKSDISSNTQDSKDGEVHTTPHEKDSLLFPTQETLYCTYGEEATITTLPLPSLPHDSTLSSLEDLIHSCRDDRSDGIGSLGFDGRPLPPINVSYPYPTTTSLVSPVSTSCIFQPSYRPPLSAYHTPYSFDTRGAYQPIVTFDDRHRDVNSLSFNSRNPHIRPTNPNEGFTYKFQHAPPPVAFSQLHRLALNDRSQRMTPNDNLLGETLSFPLMHNFANNMGSYQPIRPTSMSRAPYFVPTQPQMMMSRGTRNAQESDLPSAANTLEYQDQSPLSQGCPETSEPICTTPDVFEETAPKVKQIGTYSPEQRLERITRYRQKRAQRNFVKTIKYACRKTLADSRPRIRGRFAKNQDTPGTFGKCSNKFNDDDDDEEDLLYDEEDEGRI